MEKLPGVFITLEGIDGCGKSTQAEALYVWLSDVLGEGSVLRTFEPGGWSGGELLRGLLLGQGEKPEENTFTSRTELLLFLADRSGHVDTKILPALRAGQWVVCERYTDSTMAYQCWGRGIPSDEMDTLLNWCRFPAPDVTVFLEIDEDTACSRLSRRGSSDRMEAAGGEFVARVARGYKELAGRYPGRVVSVNASAGADEVAQNIREALGTRLAGRLPQRKLA